MSSTDTTPLDTTPPATCTADRCELCGDPSATMYEQGYSGDWFHLCDRCATNVGAAA